VFSEINGRAELKPVSIGRQNGMEAEGLQEGDRVVVHPSDQIRSGTKIGSR
jgi:HlyD family secretion protein